MPLVLVSTTLLVILGVVLVTRGNAPEDPRPTAAPSASTTPSAFVFDAGPAVTVAATASAQPSSTSPIIRATDGGMDLFQMPDGALIPVPPGFSASTPFASAAPPELPQTPEWKLEKTQRILTLVTDRAARTEKEADELDRAGKTKEAAEKRVLLTRLKVQIADMNKEVKEYQGQIVADGGTLAGGPDAR